ncbi:1-acyl-sn-glycerol-3-phosphate acyltransferase delta isoform X2 [Lagopus muta]|uniref:1-acyl-sn-glycerol-3-phosphate acyltransferase delta isoform X2 n=1 Tax=Lagopus muta TaxID=64668 RepID=UPI0020A018C2|nr:1-acyl-sn-glycerol-3-phosphate acyltransferase delta isoform X2 [Lagopus muta]
MTRHPQHDRLLILWAAITARQDTRCSFAWLPPASHGVQADQPLFCSPISLSSGRCTQVPFISQPVPRRPACRHSPARSISAPLPRLSPAFRLRAIPKQTTRGGGRSLPPGRGGSDMAAEREGEGAREPPGGWSQAAPPEPAASRRVQTSGSWRAAAQRGAARSRRLSARPCPGSAAPEMVMLLEWWSGTDCTLYTDPESYHKYGKENAIVILNHNFEIDFLCGWNFCERFGVLGSSKVLAKKELSYMPIIGWMWYFLEIVFCKRKWEEDRKTVMQKLLNLRDYPENFWFLIHCEGTRFTEQKHQASMQVAEAKGLPKLKYHLLPRTKGFAVTVQCLRNVVSAVYDSTLNFRNNENPTLLGVLNGKKYHADLYVRRIPLEEIPEDEQECSNWLHRLYQEKDAFQEEYYRTGTYPAVPIVPPRRPWTLLNWLFWASLLLYPLFKLLVNMINSGSSLTLASFGFVIVMASVGVRWMIGVTEINKGSTYGNNDNKQKQK